MAGSEAEIFGTGWDGTNESNLMTKQADGTYTKEYTVDKAYSAVQLKAVKNGAQWIGDETDNNVTFNLTGAGTFTVIYHPAVGEDLGGVEVTGDIVEFITEFKYDTVFAVGNGEGFWLNGASWDPAYAANEMNKVADDVWEIEFEMYPTALSVRSSSLSTAHGPTTSAARSKKAALYPQLLTTATTSPSIQTTPAP